MVENKLNQFPEPLIPVVGTTLPVRGEFLFGEVLPEQMSQDKPVKQDNNLTLAERAEIMENKKLADETTQFRQEQQKQLYGKTDAELEAEADAWLNGDFKVKK